MLTFSMFLRIEKTHEIHFVSIWQFFSSSKTKYRNVFCIPRLNNETRSAP